MKQVQVILCAALLAGATAMAQQPAQGGAPKSGQQPTQQQGAQGQAGAQAQTGAQGQAGAQAQPGAAQPQGKTPPQAKTQEEFNAYQEAAGKTTSEEAEAAADAFSAKYKDSEIRTVLYHRVMQMYQNANNADKAIETGRKILAITPNDPIANVMVATFISERTRDTDLDKDERLAEAQKDANRAIQTVDTDFVYPPGTPPERVEGAKAMIKSMAYSALGATESVKENYAGAEKYFQQAVSVPNAQVDAITWLQYALVLDKAKKYQDALVKANQAFNLAPAGSSVQTLVKQERDRLLKLTGSGAPSATPAAAAPAAQTPPPPKQ
jgi:tetratricopeptide (TPR) repeat protein